MLNITDVIAADVIGGSMDNGSNPLHNFFYQKSLVAATECI